MAFDDGTALIVTIQAFGVVFENAQIVFFATVVQYIPINRGIAVEGVSIFVGIEHATLWKVQGEFDRLISKSLLNVGKEVSVQLQSVAIHCKVVIDGLGSVFGLLIGGA